MKIKTLDVYSGMAMDMEEGWYGAKMTGSSVKVAFPGPRKTTQNYRYMPTYLCPSFLSYSEIFETVLKMCHLTLVKL
jgi:hypothetical protein